MHADTRAVTFRSSVSVQEYPAAKTADIPIPTIAVNTAMATISSNTTHIRNPVYANIINVIHNDNNVKDDSTFDKKIIINRDIAYDTQYTVVIYKASDFVIESNSFIRKVIRKLENIKSRLQYRKKKLHMIIKMNK